MVTSKAPRPPAPPRLEDLAVRSSLGTSVIGEDALLTGVHAAEIAWEEHTADYVELHQVRADGGTMANSSWRKGTWADVTLTGVDTANVAITDSGLHRTQWIGCRATGIVMSGSTLADTAFTDCVLDLAHLRMVTLKRVSFTGCRMRGLDLTSAQLEDVIFIDCDLSESLWHEVRNTRVQLRGCQLTGLRGVANLAGAQVEAADLLDFTVQLADALGIGLLDPQDDPA